MDGSMTRYQWKSPLPEQLPEAARAVIDALAGAPGLKACYAIKVSDTETVVVSVWDDQAAAEEALPLVEPAIQRIVGTTIRGEQQGGGTRALAPAHREGTVNGTPPPRSRGAERQVHAWVGKVNEAAPPSSIEGPPQTA